MQTTDLERVRRLSRGQEGWSQIALSSVLAVQAMGLIKSHSLQASRIPYGSGIPDPKPLRVLAEECCDVVLENPDHGDGSTWRTLAEYCAELIRQHMLGMQ